MKTKITLECEPWLFEVIARVLDRRADQYNIAASSESGEKKTRLAKRAVAMREVSELFQQAAETAEEFK